MIFIVEGIILAGGKGSRLQTNKLLLEYNGQPIIYHTVKSMLSVCDFVTIVTGYYNIDYRPYFENENRIKVIHNPNHEEGMFTSILMGVSDKSSDCFITPGDYPLVKSSTYRKLLQGKGEIRVPSYDMKGGHPIFLEKRIVEQLKKEPKDSNLKSFRNKFKVNYINVEDKGILLDIDNKEDYQNLKGVE